MLYKDTNEQDVFIPIDSESIQEARDVLNHCRISLDDDKFIVVYPSTELPHRPRLKLEKLVKTCHLIKEKGFQGKILAVGSANEGKEWEQNDINNVTDANLAGKISIPAVAAILSKASLAIGNDGGIIHVAGAVGCPLVAIMPNTPSSYRPAGRKTKIIQSSYQCCVGKYPNRPISCFTAKCTEDIYIKDIVKACLEKLPIL